MTGPVVTRNVVVVEKHDQWLGGSTSSRRTVGLPRPSACFDVILRRRAGEKAGRDSGAVVDRGNGKNMATLPSVGGFSRCGASAVPISPFWHFSTLQSGGMGGDAIKKNSCGLIGIYISMHVEGILKWNHPFLPLGGSASWKKRTGVELLIYTFV